MSQSSYWDTVLRRRVGRRKVVVGGVAVGGAALLAGCGQPAPAPTAAPVPPTSAAAPAASVTATPLPAKYGGTFRMSTTTKPPNMDIHTSPVTSLTTWGLGVAYSRLFKTKQGPDVTYPSAIPVPDLATGYEQPDDLTYVIKLNPSARFHNLPPVNARELKAEDVIFSLKRQRDLKVNASFVQGIARMEAIDRTTVKIVLDLPDADFLANLADPHTRIMPPEPVDLKGDLKEGPIIGTGPWVLESEDLTSKTTLIRNPLYFEKGVPYADRLEFIRMPDYPTTAAAFRAKQLDYMPNSVAKVDADSIKKQFPEVVVVLPKRNSGAEMGLKSDRPPFDNLKVRQAVSKAVGREQIIETVQEGLGWLNIGIPLPDLSWALPEDEFKRLYKRDVDGAKKLLAEAGQEKGFEFECTIGNNALSLYQPVAELIQAQLKEIGLAMRIKIVDSPQFTDQVSVKGEYAAYIGPQSPVSSLNADLLGKYHSRGPRHTYQAGDKTLDGLIERQAVLVRDPEGRRKLVQDVQRRIIESAFLLELWGGYSPVLWWPYVKNYYEPPAQIESAGYTYLWLDK